MKRKKERIDEILKAAELIFLKNGFLNASMDDIADIADMGKGTIYYYFKSKEEIFFTLIEREAKRVYEEIVKRVSEKDPLHKIIKEIISFYFEYFSKNRVFLKIFFPCIAGLIRIENRKLLQRYTKSYREHFQFIKRIISRKVKEEETPISAKSLLNLINLVQIGIGLKLLEEKEKEARNSTKLFLKIIRKFLEG